jgi:uroporphyrinogen decarboxylase
MNDLFLRACRRESVERTPVWIMRQAGRYLPEYREVRKKVDFLTLCRTPELATEVTLQPIDRFGFDAAILFSDILVPAEALGCRVTFNPGPVLDKPLRTAEAIDAIEVADPRESVPYVFETVRSLRRELDGRASLIGFAAAPFTLAVYLVEGQGSKHFTQVKRLLFGAPDAAHALLGKVTELTVAYLEAQIDAGAQAVQLFDTWAGMLGPDDYREFALRWAKEVLERLRPKDVPRIYFALDSAHLWGEIRHCGADVAGVDWRTPLDVASAALGDGFAVQGNLDPATLFAPPEVVDRRVRAIVKKGAGLPGHVFNLGHGIFPDTPVESVEALVRAVREGRSG